MKSIHFKRNNMKDEELIRAYIISIYIISFLSEYGKLERSGAFARVYNTIVRKNSVFQSQIDDLRKRKKDKISKKATLFLMAMNYSDIAWDNTIKEASKKTISAGITVSYLYTLNDDFLTKIYGFNDKDFIKINKLSTHSQVGVTFNSCGMATSLTEKAILTIDEEFKKIKAIK